jgi:hypothetical protein
MNIRDLRRLALPTAMAIAVLATPWSFAPAQSPTPIPEAAPTLPTPPASSTPKTPYNLHVVASESLLNRFVTRTTAEPGEVDDFVFGAKVDGRQWTTTQLSLDLRPSSDRAHAVFTLDGHVQSQTTGRTEQGAVHSLGQQQFHAVKDVFFDGLQLSTRHAGVFVRAQNQTIGASTPLDGTLFQELGTRIALKRAERNRPQAEEYARSRVVERVYPSFDKEIDQQLADANDRLDEQVRGSLRKGNLLPTSQLARSSDTHLHYAARMVVGEGASLIAPAVPLVGPHELTVYLHESLLNGLLDRLNLRGRQTTDRELRDLGRQLRQALRGGDDGDTPGEDAPGLGIKLDTEIEFDGETPLAVRFADNRMELQLRATFRPAGQAFLPPLAITVPLKLELQPSQDWTLVWGEIDIQSTNGDEVPTVAKTLVRQAIESDLPQVSFPATLKTPNWPTDRPCLRVSALQATDGWLVISTDLDNPLRKPTEPMPIGPGGVATPIRARPR